MGRPLSAEEAKDAGLVNTVVVRAEVDDVALAPRKGNRRTCRLGRRAWRAD